MQQGCKLNKAPAGTQPRQKPHWINVYNGLVAFRHFAVVIYKLGILTRFVLAKCWQLLGLLLPVRWVAIPLGPQGKPKAHQGHSGQAIMAFDSKNRIKWNCRNWQVRTKHSQADEPASEARIYDTLELGKTIFIQFQGVKPVQNPAGYGKRPRRWQRLRQSGAHPGWPPGHNLCPDDSTPEHRPA